MEQKKSIVRAAIYKKQFEGRNGIGYIYEITFDNGDKGDYIANSEKQETFKIGVDTEYTIETKTNGNFTNTVIKPVKTGFVAGKGNPAYEHRRTALKCAVDLAANKIIEKKDISTWAESFMKFLNG